MLVATYTQSICNPTMALTKKSHNLEKTIHPSFSCNLRLEAIAKYRFTFCNQILDNYAKLYNRAERFESKKVESR
jgi:hypothetical protein